MTVQLLRVPVRFLLCLGYVLAASALLGQGADPRADLPDPSPVDLWLSASGSRAAVACWHTGTVSLVDLPAGKVLHRVAAGRRTAAVWMSPQGHQVLATAMYSGTLHRFRVQQDRLVPAGVLKLDFGPRGLAVDPHRHLAYVALETGAAVAVVDLKAWQVVRTVSVGPWPRWLALAPDGNTLAVGCSGSRRVVVLEVPQGKERFSVLFEGINCGMMQVDRRGQFVYAPWMVYRQNPITPGNIRQGWVLASRLGRIRLDQKKRRQVLSLDERGKAVADPHGVALDPQERWIVCTSSGTGELLVFRNEDLPFGRFSGQGDHIDPALARDRSRFYRLTLGGRPLAVRFLPSGHEVVVANYLQNALQVVDLEKRRVVRTVALGGPSQPSLVRRGEAIFYDARRSLDQWYSCHSCHYEGGINAVTMDTRNDGTNRTFKTVLPLFHLDKTPPWTWHGWQQDLQAAMHKSLTDTMQGPQPRSQDVQALLAYLRWVEPPPNPYRQQSAARAAVQRGRKLFFGKAGCAECHRGPHYTDGEIHDVGTGSPKDAYSGYNTPTLRDVYLRVRLMHHGRARSLQQVLTEYHRVEEVSGGEPLSPQEVADLVEFLKTL